VSSLATGDSILDKLQLRAELLLILCSLIWGATFLIVKNGIQDASPLLFIAIRFGLASLVFAPLGLRSMLQLTRPAMGRGIVLGLLLFGGFAFQTMGLRYTTASKSGFITGLLVAFTPLFQLLLERRNPRWGNLAGVALVVFGLYFLTSPNGGGFNQGDFLTLICAVIFAVYIVCLDIFSKECNVTQLTFLQMLITVGLSLLFSFSLEQRYLQWTPRLLLALGYLSVLATVVTLYLQTRFQKFTTPTRAAIIFSLEPVFSAIIAYYFGGERIGWMGLAGGGLIVMGLLVSELSDVLTNFLFRNRVAAG
jgi:drug/metabolite transporter (DMT)-like permease